jgi:hypothetical protein
MRLQDHADPFPMIRATGALTAAKAAARKTAMNESKVVCTAIN